MEVKDVSYYSNTRQEMLPFIPSSAKKILEIGCGEGHFCEQLIGKDTEIWGVEPDSDSAEIAAKKLYKVLNKKINEAISQLPENYFDAIILNDVLEHLLFPWDDLKQLKSKLSDNGVIVSSIPNVRYIKNLYHVLINKNWEYTESGILDSTHFRFFTKKSMVNLFSMSGYTIEKIKGINKTKSTKYLLFALLINVLFFFNHADTLYVQYAVRAKKS